MYYTVDNHPTAVKFTGGNLCIEYGTAPHDVSIHIFEINQEEPFL
nr:MAG TPA: hypothetical protein [Caudoviricetes sp.]